MTEEFRKKITENNLQTSFIELNLKKFLVKHWWIKSNFAMVYLMIIIGLIASILTEEFLI